VLARFAISSPFAPGPHSLRSFDGGGLAALASLARITSIFHFVTKKVLRMLYTMLASTFNLFIQVSPIFFFGGGGDQVKFLSKSEKFFGGG